MDILIKNLEKPVPDMDAQLVVKKNYGNIYSCEIRIYFEDLDSAEDMAELLADGIKVKIMEDPISKGRLN